MFARILSHVLTVFLILILHQHSRGFFRNNGAQCTRLSSVFDSPNFNEIEENLYLGNAKAAAERSILRSLNITHVLTIDNRPIPKRIFRKLNITNLYIKAGDSPEQLLLPYFPITNDFIDEGVTYGAILVHCHHGISRSATLVIAYCMEKYNISYPRALKYVRNRRSFIRPNPGFEQQLKEYYDAGFRVRSRSMLQLFQIKAMKHKIKIVSAAVLIVCMMIPVAIII